MISKITLTVTSGAQHSDIADLRNFRGLATLVAGTLTSCQLYMQVGVQANSANLKRLDALFDASATTVSTTAVWSVGVGNRAVQIGKFLGGANYMRLETSVAQADNRPFTLIVGGL